jgi:hypothetical protein
MSTEIEFIKIVVNKRYILKVPCEGQLLKMNNNDEKQFIKRLENILYLFIDEWSMIPPIFFLWLSVRLKQIYKNSKEDFPNIRIILAGDSAQLPPVRHEPIWRNQSRLFKSEGKNIF